MSNVIYEGSYYNAAKKLKFMEEQGEGTKKIYDRAFKISNDFENDLKKDLGDFNRDELRRLFYTFRAKTKYSSKANVQMVSTYISWYISDIGGRGLNPLDSVDTEWKEQFVNQSLKKYWTETEINHILNTRHNKQDAATVILLFEGCRGEGNAEITNLKIEDVNDNNNTLRLTDEDESIRYITVSEKCIEICLKASKESDYEKKNGNFSPDIKAERSNLVSNRYIVKSSNTRTINFARADKNIVHRRLSNIAEEIGESGFSPLNITYSGIICKARDLYLATGRLDEEEYKVLCDQFKIDSEQSLTRLKSEFMNLDFIKSFYELT